MHKYIVIQHTYDTFEIGLFINAQCIDTLSADKKHTSTFFIVHMQQLLSMNAIAFAELSYCVVNCGPGPFSTLRSIIASVNGLHCATGIPLVGIDGLEATFLQLYDPAYENTAVLLNAFNNESYYLIAQGKTIISTGYKNTIVLQQELSNAYGAGTINIIDNKTCSLATIAQLGYEKYVKEPAYHGYLKPLHLKKHAVEK